MSIFCFAYFLADVGSAFRQLLMHLNSLVFRIHLILSWFCLAGFYFPTLYLTTFALSFSEQMQFWAGEGVGFIFPLTYITIISLQFLFTAEVMAHLRSNLYLNIVYLRINFVNVALGVYVVHFTLFNPMIMIFTHNLIYFLVILTICTLTFLVAHNRYISNTINIILRIQFIQIFKFIRAGAE